ncbi:MAG: hypothetical protein ACRDTD_00315 [Pseudonocardiaceae bacterium]
MTDTDRELLDTIAAEAARDIELPYRRRAGGTHPVYGLRLPTERIEQLRRLAEARGVEPSVLARQLGHRPARCRRTGPRPGRGTVGA